MLQNVRILSVLFALFPAIAWSEWEVNMTRGVTDTSAAVFDLHMIVFYICVAISVVVFGVMFWSIYHHRKSKGAESHPFHESTSIEILWTIVPTIILIIILVPATKTLVESYDTSESDMDIQVTGYQWKWRYKYIGQDVDFFSVMTTPSDEIYNKADKNPNYLLEVDNPLVVPINKKIRFLFTSNDVIHAWWVPALALKKDAIPGFINESFTKINKPGIYRGQCAELCGKDHGFMPIVIKAVPEEEYIAWLDERKSLKEKEASASQKDWTMEELMAKGEQVYNKSCSACHQPTGVGLPPVFPALKGSAIALGPMDDHLDIVFNGKSGTGMSGFGEQLSAVDLAAVVTYERNAWGNNVGDILLPADVEKMKGGK
ncbi:cytochrome c oxidase subunit II [Gammaproteobacteria bacterium 42_54_T18]|nr:cytochrome c oxidase subunit II [Gammaproteobacteria bacterium 42_54_T18]